MVLYSTVAADLQPGDDGGGGAGGGLPEVGEVHLVGDVVQQVHDVTYKNVVLKSRYSYQF